MRHLSNRQLHAAIAQLDQALHKHEQWQKDVLRLLVLGLPPDAADLAADAHLRCGLGQWYESDVGALREHSGFAALGESHRQMHESATRLLRRSADELEVSAIEYDQFNNLLDRVRLEIQSLRSELAELAHNRDPLTGARNRVGLLADLREQQALVRRGVQECSLVMVDIDHFKAINDNHGHAAGDAALSSIARTLQANLRPYDRLYRYGGEEFLVTMPQVAAEEARQAAGRLRVAIAAQEIEDGVADGSVHVTASFGVARLDPDRSVEESVDRADKALYRAKAGGRDRVEVAAD